MSQNNEEFAAMNEELMERNRSLLKLNQQLSNEIEQRKAAEEIREAFEAQNLIFRNALDRIHAYVYLKDTEGHYTYANKLTLELFKCTAEELIGKTDFDFFTPEFARTLREIDQSVMSKGIDTEEELETVNENGEKIFYLEVKTPVFSLNEPKKIIGICGISTDISWQKKVEIELNHSHQLLKYIIEHNRSSVAVFDRNMNYIYVSQHYMNDFNLDLASDIIGKNHYDLFPYLPAQFKLAHQRALQGEVLSNDNNQLVHPDGTISWTHWECRPWFASDGSIGGMVLYTEDITERKKAEVELKEQQRQLSSLISNLPGFVYRCKNDEHWTMLYISEGCHPITGYWPNEFINNRIIDFNSIIAAEYRDALFDEWKNTIEKKTSFRYEYEIINKQGERIWVLERGTGIYNDQQELIFLEGYIEDISERKTAELQLIESEQNYRELIDGMNETVWVIDFEGNLLDVNETAIHTMGYTKDELLGIGLYGIDATLKKEMIVALAKSMPEDELQIFETTHQTKSGEIIPVEVYSSLVSYQGKRVILSIARNISNRKRMEQKLRESEETIRLLFNSTAEGIYGIDTNGMCTFCNKAALKMLGYTLEEEVIGKNMHELIHHHHPDHSPYPIDECTINNTFRRKCGTHSDTEVFWRSNGTGVPVEFWSFPIERDKKVIGAVVTFIDISQRKHDEEVQQILYEIARTSMSANAMEEMLGVVRMELSKVIDTSNFYVALFKKESNTLQKIIYINEKRKVEEWDIHETLSGEVIRQQKTLLLKQREINEFRKKFRSLNLNEDVKCWLGVPLIENNEAIGVMVVQSYSNENAFNKGHARLLEMIAHELTIVVQRNRMILDLIKAKDKAEESDRLKSSFLANLSHEIRTPMNSIMGFASLLPEEEDNALIQQYAEIIVRNSEQLVHIIDDIVLYSRLQTRLLTFSPSEFSAETLLGDIARSFNLPEFTEKVALLVDPHCDGKITIRSDYEKLRQVITNLVFNAFKYTPLGSITLGVEKKQDCLEFFVRDTGIGIPASEKEKIFERFYRASNVDKGAISGTGLGLSIVKELIELAGGSIWVESTPAQGSTFYFTLPAT